MTMHRLLRYHITIFYKFVIDYHTIYHRGEISLCDVQY